MLFIGVVSANILKDQNSEEIDPIKQTDDSAEDNDQNKRTLFGNGHHYALEKHVKYHPSGYKYFLGYRPVKLQLVPVAKPLYMRTAMRPMMHLRPIQIGNKPVVSLVPPKLNPVYKPGGYVYNKPLPVNVPPSIPSKPWQHQGWDTFKPEIDNKPFTPSVPLPEPENNLPDPNFVQPTVPAISPSVFPTSVNVGSKPVFNLRPVHSFLPNVPFQPAIPIHPTVPVQPAPPLPAVNLQPTIPLFPPVQPLPSPVQPVIPLQPGFPTPAHPGFPTHAHPGFPTAAHPGFPIPAHPGFPIQPNVNTVLHHSHLLPINFLPGKLNIPVPNLGVLPLGSSVPVQLSQQPQLIHRPAVLPVGSSTPVHFVPQHSHVLHKAPILPIDSPLSFHLAPQHPQEFPRTPVIEPPVVQKVVPQLHQGIIPRPQVYVGGSHTLNGTPLENGFAPAESSPQHPHIQISLNQHQPEDNNAPHTSPEQHNYQYFVQHFPSNDAQQNSINIQSQQYEMGQQHHEDQIHEQQIYHGSPGFFQPGKTDLQIPEYLPAHPHFKHMQEYSQENSYDTKKR